MKNYTIRLNVEGMDPIDFNVTKETYKKFSVYCKENYPDKDWKSSEN